MSDETREQAVGIFGGELLLINKYCTIDIDAFLALFADAFPNPTYTKLMEIDEGKMGYEQYFTKLKDDGKLPQ